MAKMGTVWDRTAEFLSDNLGAILPVALLAFFVPASIEGSFQAAKTGGGPELVLSLYAVQLAFGILSLWGSLTISAMALDMASARGAGAIGRDRLLPALAVSVLLFAVMFLLVLPVPLALQLNGYDLMEIARGANAGLGPLAHLYLDGRPGVEVLLVHAKPATRHLHDGVGTKGIQVLVQTALARVVADAKFACGPGE